MEYKTGKRMFRLILTAQEEGFSLEEIQKLLERSWDSVKFCNEPFDDLVFEKYTKGDI